MALSGLSSRNGTQDRPPARKKEACGENIGVDVQMKYG